MISRIAQPSQSDLRKPVILVVDEDRANLARVRDCLAMLDSTVLAADEANSAVQLAAQANPDLILLDIAGPALDGITLYQLFRTRENTRAIPILYMTDDAETGHRVKGLERGMVDYIAKPFRQEELLCRISVHLHNTELARKLQQANDLLEARVKERTAELASTINALNEKIIQLGRKEEQLRRSAGQLRSLLRTIPDLIWLKDKSGRFLSCNQQFERLLGVGEMEIIGKTDYDFFESDLADYFTEHDRVAMEAGKPVRNEEWVVYADDHHRALLETIKTPMYDETGALIGVLGIGRDMTERKQSENEHLQLQAQLQQLQKMEAIGQLAGGVAHDFNNMLGVILGHAELAMSRVNPTTPQFVDLKQIHKAAERSRNIARQLLTFARRQTIAPQSIDLNATIAGMLSMLKRLIGEEIQFAWYPGHGAWPVHMDPSQMDQIMVNLCVNARNAISGIGRITVVTANYPRDDSAVQLHTESSPRDYVGISVSDTGCGMDQETLSHIFEPFFTTKAMGEGTGLGLATVYGIVRQNGGFIHTDSTVGKGTTFTIYLPRHDGEADFRRDEETSTSPAGGHETILLVEDEPAILKMTAAMLKLLGYTVLTATTPGEAIAQLEQHDGTIQLLITDVVMPEMNGQALAARLQHLRPGLRTVFMSGYDSPFAGDGGENTGRMFFLQKPFSRQELAAVVRLALTADRDRDATSRPAGR